MTLTFHPMLVKYWTRRPVLKAVVVISTMFELKHPNRNGSQLLRVLGLVLINIRAPSDSLWSLSITPELLWTQETNLSYLASSQTLILLIFWQ